MQWGELRFDIEGLKKFLATKKDYFFEIGTLEHQYTAKEIFKSEIS